VTAPNLRLAHPPLPAASVGPFTSPAWLPGGHAQTIYPHLLPRPALAYRRERVDTPDGDFWDFDWLDDASADVPTDTSADVSTDTPLVVVFHGLEGSARSRYALHTMTRLRALGWRGVVPHFRGCSGTPNRRPRAYHSGDHEEIGAMLHALRARVGRATPIHALGVSLGGSALLNWIGRAGANAQNLLTAAATVSTPLDLMASGIAIDRGFNAIYARHFLATLKPKALALAQRFPDMLDARRIRRVYTMWEFDDAVTSPLHGFAGTRDYWTRASSKPWLREVALPTLVVNARNDPFVPGASLPNASETTRAVILEQPARGGHVGFMTGAIPGRDDWMPRRVLDFFQRGC
jgi:predicted alpha/beta-fold hydrolase